jgi:two-component system, OmpR family, alkaline phosphatase synthesis response regulator PhoP
MPLPQNSTEVVPEHTAPAGAERRVLVIDDSALIREAAKIALETVGGLDVLVAGSGEEGIPIAETERPDAILLDVEMPGMDGLAVAERLQSLPATSSSPVVLLTARDSPEDREHFRHVPVVGVIAKPFDIHALADELAELLGWTR